MALSTQDQALRYQFADMISMNLANTKSRIRPRLRNIKQQNGSVAFWDGLDGLDSYEIIGRNQETQNTDANHTRRRMVSRRFATSILLDKKDSIEMIVDPTSPYAKRMAEALMTRFDKLFFYYATATVTLGLETTTTKTFAADGGKTVDLTGGITYEGLLPIPENFIDAGVDLATTKVFFAGTGQENTAFMKEQELTSGDFTRQFAVERGSVTNIMGMETIYFPRLAKNGDVLSETSSVRNCLAFSEDAVAVGIGSEIDVRITEESTRNFSKQVWADMIVSFVRTEGGHVQLVQTPVV